MFNQSLIDKVKISKNDLLEKLRDNKAAHIVEVSNLLEARRVQILEDFEIIIENIARKADYQPPEHMSYPKPEDHSADYDVAISMVEMEVDDTITLAQDQFKRVVMDQWEWRAELDLANATYGGKLGTARGVR